MLRDTVQMDSSQRVPAGLIAIVLVPIVAGFLALLAGGSGSLAMLAGVGGLAVASFVALAGLAGPRVPVTLWLWLCAFVFAVPLPGYVLASNWRHGDHGGLATWGLMMISWMVAAACVLAALLAMWVRWEARDDG